MTSSDVTDPGNALSPTHRLPSEVMAQIFMWLQIFYRGNLEWSGGDARSLSSWIRVTHVSQRWRDIALSSKALYSTILTHNLQYSKEMLEHSGSVALSLIDSVDFRTEGMWNRKELQELVIAVLPRVRRLWLDRQSLEFLRRHLEMSNLAFEELYLRQWDSFRPTIFPTSLRYLRLHWCLFHSYEWLSKLSNMVELTIVPAYNGTLVAVDVLLDILDKMPRLISLEISTIFRSEPAQANRVSPISPKLRYLKVVHDCPEPLIEFFPWLTFAPRFTIDALIQSSLNPIVDWLPTICAQVGHHLKASTMVLRRANLTWGGDYSGSEMHFHEGAEEEPYFRLRLFLSSRDMFRAWLWSIEALPLGEIESLTMDAPTHVVDWINTPWRTLHTLHRLLLRSEQTSSTFLDFLVAQHAKNDPPSAQFAPFPSLQELELCSIEYDGDLKSKLLGTLAKRMNRGLKLRKLVFRNSNISEDSIKQLSEVVDIVERHGEKKGRR
ncbi:hypothetical protein BDN72DRAFT_844299 [Pluteus cervinus]|uniref:Uncharacterized protein n=1 Tax=Pluteus cervinus TaxID=181527 RepID=A0ACD3AL05_9AGAR|nr:hypothetical protein BDN72DRAFT_844299 [Pluteus cervinus]